jgi:hypothetical protein
MHVQEAEEERQRIADAFAKQTHHVEEVSGLWREQYEALLAESEEEKILGFASKFHTEQVWPWSF